MKTVITAILCACAFFAVAAAASAGTSYTLSGACAKPDMQSIPAGDKAGHAFAIAHGACTVKDQIAGVTASGGTFAESDDVTAARIKLVASTWKRLQAATRCSTSTRSRSR